MNKLLLSLLWIFQPVLALLVIIEIAMATNPLDYAFSFFYISLGAIQLIQFILLSRLWPEFKTQMKPYKLYLYIMLVCMCIPIYGWLVIYVTSPIAAILYFIYHTRAVNQLTTIDPRIMEEFT